MQYDYIEVAMIQSQIEKVIMPRKLFLFGSQAKGTATDKSDYDLCVVAETTNRRALLTELYLRVESKRPIDFLLYTPQEWQRHSQDPQSFAHKIQTEGVMLCG